MLACLRKGSARIQLCGKCGEMKTHAYQFQYLLKRGALKRAEVDVQTAIYTSAHGTFCQDSDTVYKSINIKKLIRCFLCNIETAYGSEVAEEASILWMSMLPIYARPSCG